MMPVRRKSNGTWFYRKQVKLPDGSRVRITGTPMRNTKLAAEIAEREHIDRTLEEFRNPQVKKEGPTFSSWFKGRFTDEWIVGRGNKPGEAVQKKLIFEGRLEPVFGHLRLDQIGVTEIAQFRASLVREELAKKSINNILTVLSKALRYAADVELIARAPKVGTFKIHRTDSAFWEIDEYANILDASRVVGPEWYVAVCLAGDAGLRVGEIRALRWKEDVDLVARTITVNRQARQGFTGTPKGGRSRVVPMTSRVESALRGLPQIRTGFVVRNLDGTAKTDGQTTKAIRKIYQRAALKAVGEWHLLRHTFATHAAMFGVNPWTLMSWLGHARIDETMRYVSVAGAHFRPIAQELTAAAAHETDPSRRALVMLGRRGTGVAPREEGSSELEEGQLLR
jgi:integrase